MLLIHGDLDEVVSPTSLLESKDFLIRNNIKIETKMIKKENADCILSWCLEHSPNYSIYKKHFFFNLPEKFRPIELHFGVKTFQKA